MDAQTDALEDFALTWNRAPSAVRHSTNRDVPPPRNSVSKNTDTLAIGLQRAEPRLTTEANLKTALLLGQVGDLTVIGRDCLENEGESVSVLGGLERKNMNCLRADVCEHVRCSAEDKHDAQEEPFCIHFKKGVLSRLTTKITDSHWQRARDCNNSGLSSVTVEIAALSGCSVHLLRLLEMNK